MSEDFVSEIYLLYLCNERLRKARKLKIPFPMFYRNIRCIIKSEAPFKSQIGMNNNFYGSMNQTEKDVVNDYIRDLMAIAVSHLNNNLSNTYCYDRL